ncbi:unnamed protein product, partial [Rotaria sp. Silwood1]
RFDFIDDGNSDECACAIINLLSKARSCLYDSVNDVFGANCYLTQHFLFEYFTNDALLSSSNDLFINLIVNLFIDLLNMIFIRMMKTKKK